MDDSAFANKWLKLYIIGTGEWLFEHFNDMKKNFYTLPKPIQNVSLILFAFYIWIMI